MNKTIIKVENLSKVYKLYDKHSDRLKEALKLTRKACHREHYALNNISFDVQKGETIGIIGSNGSGKSTLLKIITGVLTQTKGDLVVNGAISALLELGTGFNPEYTGMQNIYLYGTMIGQTKEEIEKELQSIIDFADIGEFIHQPVKTYSSGMFARLAFSVAINVNPDILIVDEILSVGDTRFQLKCMNKMHDMMVGGTTILFVNHDINAIKRFCTRVIWLNKGEIIESGDVDSITDKYLDFLRAEDYNKSKKEIDNRLDHVEQFNNSSQVASIKSFRILNYKRLEVETLGINEKVAIEVGYEVFDETILNPIIGVAIRTVDQKYVCGLNTLLDSIEIPWKRGQNKFYLEYPLGILAVGGKYFFDIAIFDKTATVPIHYISQVKEITVASPYVGEGIYIPPHEWRDHLYE